MHVNEKNNSKYNFYFYIDLSNYILFEFSRIFLFIFVLVFARILF